MPRANRTRPSAAPDSDANDSAADDILDNPATTAANSESVENVAASNPESRGRREVMAEVARNRASFFARGAGAAAERRAEETGEQATSNRRSSGSRHRTADGDEGDGVVARSRGGAGEDEEPRAHWPGPFATARNLLKARKSAKAAREDVNAAHDDGKGAMNASSVGSKHWNIPIDAGDEVSLLQNIQLDDIDLAEYTPEWTAPLHGTDNHAVDNHTFDNHTLGDASGRSDAVNGGLSLSGKKRKRGAIDGIADPSDPGSDAARFRAIAGPSGVRLQVPPLTVLCMEALMRFLPQIPAPSIPGLRLMPDGTVAAATGILAQKHQPLLGTTDGVETEHSFEDFGLDAMMPDVRNKFCLAACRARAMDNHTFALLTYNCSDELNVPDCAGIDENTMVKCLQHSKGLTILRLGHCGRGLSDKAAEQLSSSGVLNSLVELEIAGAFVLTDAGLSELLRGCPKLRRLAVKQCPLITGAFIETLCKEKQLNSLEELALWSLPLVTDAILLGATPVITANSQQTPSMEVKPARGGGLKAWRAKQKGQIEADGDEIGVEIDDEESLLQKAIQESIESSQQEKLAAATPAKSKAVSKEEELAGLSGGLLRIAGQLRGLSLRALDNVSDALLTRLCGSLTPDSWNTLEVGNCPLIHADGLCKLLALQGKSLQTLYLSGSTFTARVLWMVAATVSNLRVLELPKCPNICEYTAGWAGPAPEILVVHIIRNCGDSLQRVVLSSMPGLRASTLCALGKHASKLQSLDISFSRGVSDAAAAYVCNHCSELRRLLVWGCTNLTEKFFFGHNSALSESSQLRIYGKPGDIMPAPEYN